MSLTINSRHIHGPLGPVGPAGGGTSVEKIDLYSLGPPGTPPRRGGVTPPWVGPSQTPPPNLKKKPVRFFPLVFPFDDRWIEPPVLNCSAPLRNQTHSKNSAPETNRPTTTRANCSGVDSGPQVGQDRGGGGGAKSRRDGTGTDATKRARSETHPSPARWGALVH